ncbi:response regulator [Bacteriovorax sp. DB6_IX]|uniref:response regulator n=1 Tax=Bacteriovorax sp. DB6_IX TaxID=1353530 RepID=UPI00038A1F0E|nr:response regulator [Bacteriovorax sp. DB6_IX]EQC52641.1 response regulator receiver domain protein [Bacteriovorax sp. DB6_IX]
MSDLLQNRKILYIEDEVDLAKIIEDELVELGAEVLRTEKISRAQEALSKIKFDLIITDFLLQDGTGDTIVSKLKSCNSELNCETPIIVTSAFIGQDLLDEFEGKVAAVLTKPHSMERLLNKIQEIFE